MTFTNEKKTYLAKMDKSKKGEIDEKIKPLLAVFNARDQYYTTSSCSGRVYLWKGTGKKNETQWLRVSHDPIDASFFSVSEAGLVWLRLEGVILHIACQDLAAANELLEKARRIYKKSSILSASNKIIVELRGSECMEMPFYQDGVILFSGEFPWLADLINRKMEKMWEGIEKIKEILQ